MQTKIKQLRERTGLTQAEFGKLFHLPKRTLEAWEMGERNPPDYLIELINYKINREVNSMITIQSDRNRATHFCDCCGYYLDVPVDTEDYDIWCPNCGANDVYENTAAGSRMSVDALNESEDKQLLWEN